MSNSLASRLVNLVLRNETYAPANPNFLWVGLFHSSTGLNGGSLADEVPLTAGGNYARSQINLLSTPMFSVSTNGSVSSNLLDIGFATATGTLGVDDWGPVGTEITSAALIDSATLGAGNILIWGNLAVSKVVVVGDQFKITASDFRIQFS